MVKEISVEELRPFLGKDSWKDRNKPIMAAESSDEKFFAAMRESAEFVNASTIMNAFRVKTA